jgi:flagellar hook-associated protein 1 FlgK
MSNLFNTLNVGRSGLSTSSSLINATSHNVANANTEGFTRRSGRVETNDPVHIRGHDFGEGASLDGFTRHAEVLVDERLMESIGEESQAAAMHQALYELELYFSEDVPNGPSQALDAFFDSLARLTTDPSDRALRETVLEAGDRLSDSVQRTATALSDRLDDIEDQLSATVGSVQLKLDQVAKLNGLITEPGSNLGQGDYQDQRDLLVRELAESVGLEAQFKGNGQVDLLIGGHFVVQGTTARDLTVDTTTAGTVSVDMETGGGTIDVTTLLGGDFGGLLDAHDAAEGYATELDTWVDTFATAFNTQHGAGFDSAGAAGGDFFSFTAGSEAITLAVDATLRADPTLLAVAGAATAAVGDGDNLALMLDVEDQLLHAGGTRSTTEALADIYASVGRDIETAEMDQGVFELELEDLLALRDSVSSVDLDEEAANLMAYQASYQAAARVLTTTNDLLDVLMGVGA